MSELEYKIIVGLEIHIHLATRTKLFCGCELAYGQRANTKVCEVCLGMPGSLPVMNKDAFEMAVLTGLALNCEIPSFTKWDRKSYYYPDLPKNYQISQYDLPMSVNGSIEISLEDGSTKKIRIIRAHLEEDAGKNTHTLGDFSAIDLNRAGTPLLEIVTEPDMNSSYEVKEMATQLQRIVRYLGVSQGDMQKGHMRFEPNINLHIKKDGKIYKTPITEVKNLNSFRALERSVQYEAQRQLRDFVENGKVMAMGNKTTRGWDDANEVTVLQREKEEAHDYRYFPDPDLLPIDVDQAWLTQIKQRLCELPIDMQKRFVTEYKLSEYDAQVLTSERSIAEFFDSAVKAPADPKRVCNLLTQTGLKIANEKGCQVNELGINPDSLAKLANMVSEGMVSASAGETIFEKMAENFQQPKVIAEELNLIQTSDTSQLEEFLEKAMEQNPQAVEEAKSGSKKAKKAKGFLMGQVMQMSKGQANPKIVNQILAKKLSQ